LKNKPAFICLNSQ